MSVRALVTTVIAILLVAAVTGTILYSRCQPGRAAGGPGSKGPEAAQVPAVKVEDFTPQHYEAGRPAWKIRLAELAIEKGGRTITTGQLREGLIYDQQGRPAVRVTASTVNYDTTKYDFDVAGGVRVISPKGAVISTEKVHWDNQSRQLIAPGKVVVRVKGATVTTSGLTFDTPKQIVYCPNQLRIDTGRSEGVGRNLVYYLDSEPQKWTLQNVQMVIDVQEAEERTGGH
jgi:LPS export ABC transporter protein LptC